MQTSRSPSAFNEAEGNLGIQGGMEMEEDDNERVQQVVIVST